EGASGDDGVVARDRAARRPHPGYSIAPQAEAGRGSIQADSRAAGAGIAKCQPLWIEPAVAASVARLDDPRAEVGKAVARLIAAQQLDVADTPAVQRAHEMLLVLHPGICRGAEQVALFLDAEVITRQIGGVGEPLE